MRKAIVGLVWYEVWENFKKNFWCIVVLILVFITRSCIEYTSEYIFGITLMDVGFYISIYNMKAMPLRMCKGIYACPVDEKSKVFYLSIKMVIETLKNILLYAFCALICVDIGIFGTEILSKKTLWVLVFLSAFHLTILHGANEEAKVKVDERGYRIFSKAERMIRTNFLILLILQWAFYLFYIGKVFTIGKYVSGTSFLMCSLANVIILAKYLKPYLLELIAYERVYNYKPKEEIVQYDI